jgi:hypothetical protein
MRRGKLTVPGKHSLECLQKGLVTSWRGTLVVDEAHVSWGMPRIWQGLPTPPEVWNGLGERV